MTEKRHEKLYTAICSEKTLQSNDKGFFMQFVDNVSKNAGKEWIQNCFGKLKSDKERIKIIYDYEPVQNVVYYTFSHVQEIYRKKNAEVAQSRRKLAEEMVKKGEKQKVLTLYSQSVLRSPPTGENNSIDNGLSLALALWGRSEILISMNEYEFALSDIQAALKECLQTSYKPEAFWRMGICYRGMREENKANVSFGVAEKLLENDEDKLKSLRRNMKGEYPELKKKFGKVLPVVTGGYHPDYPYASKKMCIKQAKGLGRYAAAQDKFKTGDTIAVEPPYAACLLPEHFGTHCHHCFERFISPVGCPTCSSLAFCTAKCRDAAISTYHQYECKYLDLLIGSGMSILGHTCLRMITQNTLKRNLDIYKDRKLEKVYSLCTNAEDRESEDFFQRTLMACFLLRCLQKSGYFLNKNTDDCAPTEDELKIGELLLLHLQILQFNAHEVYETRRTPEHKYRGSRAFYIGVAVYPTVALFNHDCYAAVTRYFVGKNIIINAVRPIQPGEIIAENYGPVFTRRKLAERQKSLVARYWFTCRCNACAQDWPSLNTGLENVPKKIRCPTENCSYAYTLPVSSEIIKCPRCKKKVSLTERILKLNICEEQLTEAFNSVEDQESAKGIQLLIQAIEIFHQVSVPPHRDVHLGQELLRTFLADNGNVHICIQQRENS